MSSHRYIDINLRLKYTDFFVIFRPPYDDEQGWFQFIMQNFERHYLGTRAPFDVYISQGYIASNPAIYKALERFIEYITRLSDVFMVSSGIVKMSIWTNNVNFVIKNIYLTYRLMNVK